VSQAEAPRWSLQMLEEDAATAIVHFRDIRMRETLEQYVSAFASHRDAVQVLLKETDDLLLIGERLDLLCEPELLTAIRYLASPAVSEDDLKVLADAVLTSSRLRGDTQMAQRVIDMVLLGLDPFRFPWVIEGREATEVERSAAVAATAALIATQKVQTARRNEAKDEQEASVADCLEKYGFVRVERRKVVNASHLPEVGQFCGESMFGSRKADLIVRLWDGRTMPLECKVSNSATNSVKRLNNDAAVKAKTWIQEFGTTNVVPAAVLSGVFKVHNLASAQADHLTLFWAHRLEAMTGFIESTRIS